VGWAPQQAVLQRAAAMISVGGMGTVKECLWHAVPLVLAPHFNPYDAQGNAARVRYHGLGATVSEAELGRGGLERALERALAGEFAEALGRIQAQVRAVEAGDRGVTL